MKGILVDRDNQLSVVDDLPIPSYGDYECLVQMISCGACGTDMKILHNKLKFYENYPTVLGHEGVGEVVEVGKKVRNFKKGDIVVLPFGPDVVDETRYSTWGAFAEYGTIGDYKALEEDGKVCGKDPEFKDGFYAQRVLPEGIDPVMGCMIVTFREVYGATIRLGFQKGDSILVYGGGPVGLTFIKLAKLEGLGPIIAVDIRDDKLANMKAAGADYVFNSTQCDLQAEVRKLLPDGVQNIVDAAGVPALINSSLEFIKEYGNYCVYGVTAKNEHLINWEKAPYSFNIRFIQWPIKKQEGEVHDQICKWILEGKLKCEDFISDVFDLDHGVEAIRLLESGKAMKKVVVKLR